MSTTNTEITVEATITNMMGYEIYMLATEHLARMIEYPAYDDWGAVKDEIRRAKDIRTYMEKKFPELNDEEIKKRCDNLLEKASEIYERRCKFEREALERRLEYGKVTIEDVK